MIKRKLLVYSFLTTFLMLFTSIIYASDGQVPTPIATRFNEEFLPHIITFLVALGGNAVGNTIVKKIFDKSLNLLGFSKDKLSKSIEVVETSNKLSEEIKERVVEKLTTAIDEIDKLKDNVGTLATKVEDSITTQENKLEAIIKILKIVFTNDEDLVRKGYASLIEKVVEDGKKEKTNLPNKI